MVREIIWYDKNYWVQGICIFHENKSMRDG